MKLDTALWKIASAGSAFAVIFTALGCSSPAGAPSAPSSPGASSTATVRSIHVIGPPNSYIVVGDTAQFTAVANRSDGTTTDVTAQAAWSTSDATIFAVAAGGKVTAMRVGSADIRATWEGLTDKDYTTAQPFLTFKAYGTVTEAPPGFVAVAGVHIEITGSTTLDTVTDGSGDYSFSSLKGGVYSIKVSRDGYQAQTKSVTLTRDARTDFLLFPVPPAGATARCKDKSWSFVSDKAAACSKNGGVAYWACPGPFC